MKKILCLMLAFCLIMSASAAMADGGDCGNGLKWDFSNGTLTISYTGSGSGAMTDNSSPWDSHSKNIRTIIIGEGVTHIGAKAFYKYHNPTRLIISDTVTTIGDGAFYACWGINSVTMGRKVQSIGDEAFLNCSGFKTLILPDTLDRIGRRAFYQCFELEKLTFMVPEDKLHELEVGSEAFGDKRKAAVIAYSSEKAILKDKKTDVEVAEGSGVEQNLSNRQLIWVKHNPSNYVVTFDPNDGGMLKAGITTQRIPVNTSEALYTREKLDLQNLDPDLSFAGWATKKDAKKAEYADGAVFKATDDITLYAVWLSGDHIITFDPNGGTFSAKETTMTVKKGATVFLPAAQALGLSNTDQELFFTGWSKTKDGAVNYIDCAECTPEEDMTLYAVWSKDGDGSEGNPRLIDSFARLKKLAAEVSGGNHYMRTYFKLTAQIDCTSEVWTPIGESYNHSFDGVFDGSGHRVSYKMSASEGTYQGLFGCIDSGGTIKNLIVRGTIKGKGKYCGGVVGWVSTSCAVINCCSIVDVSSTVADEGDLGGIAGCNTGIIDYCVAQGHITNDGNEKICVGGIAGVNQSGTVSHCSATGRVGTTKKYVGMVVGDNCADSFAAGTVAACNYLSVTAGSYKGVGNEDGGTDTGAVPMTVKEMDAYAQKLGDKYAVCRKGIQVGMDWGGSDGDDRDAAAKGSSSSGGCDTQTGVGLWGACGVALALLFVRRNKPTYRGRAADYF